MNNRDSKAVKSKTVKEYFLCGFAKSISEQGTSIEFESTKYLVFKEVLSIEAFIKTTKTCRRKKLEWKIFHTPQMMALDVRNVLTKWDMALMVLCIDKIVNKRQNLCHNAKEIYYIVASNVAKSHKGYKGKDKLINKTQIDCRLVWGTFDKKGISEEIIGAAVESEGLSLFFA